MNSALLSMLNTDIANETNTSASTVGKMAKNALMFMEISAVVLFVGVYLIG